MEPIQLPVGNPVIRKTRYSSKGSSKIRASQSSVHGICEGVPDNNSVIIQIPVGRPIPSGELTEAHFQRDKPDVAARISTGLNHITLIPVGNGLIGKKSGIQMSSHEKCTKTKGSPVDDSKTYRGIKIHNRCMSSVTISDNQSIGTQTQNEEVEIEQSLIKPPFSDNLKSKFKEKTVFFPLRDKQANEKKSEKMENPSTKTNLSYKHSHNDYQSDIDSVIDSFVCGKKSKMADIYSEFVKSRSLRRCGKPFDIMSSANTSFRCDSPTSHSKDSSLQRNTFHLESDPAISNLTKSKYIGQNKSFFGDRNRSFLGLDNSPKSLHESDLVNGFGDQWPSYRELLNTSRPKGLSNISKYGDSIGSHLDQSVLTVEERNGMDQFVGNKSGMNHPGVHFWMTNLPDGSSLATIQTSPKQTTRISHHCDESANTLNNSQSTCEYFASNNNASHSRESLIKSTIIEPNGIIVQRNCPNFKPVSSFNSHIQSNHLKALISEPGMTLAKETQLNANYQYPVLQMPGPRNHVDLSESLSQKVFPSTFNYQYTVIPVPCINEAPQMTGQVNLLSADGPFHRHDNHFISNRSPMNSTIFPSNQTVLSLLPVNVLNQTLAQGDLSFAPLSTNPSAPSTYVIADATGNHISLSKPSGIPQCTHYAPTLPQQYILTPAPQVPPKIESTVKDKSITTNEGKTTPSLSEKQRHGSAAPYDEGFHEVNRSNGKQSYTSLATYPLTDVNKFAMESGDKNTRSSPTKGRPRHTVVTSKVVVSAVGEAQPSTESLTCNE